MPKLNPKRTPKADRGVYGKANYHYDGSYANIFSDDIQEWISSRRKRNNDFFNRLRKL